MFYFNNLLIGTILLGNDPCLSLYSMMIIFKARSLTKKVREESALVLFMKNNYRDDLDDEDQASNI